MSSDESDASIKIKKEIRDDDASNSSNSNESSPQHKKLLNQKRKKEKKKKIKKKRKKSSKRNKRSEFIDMEAEESSSEEESYDDGEGEITKEQQEEYLRQYEDRKKKFSEIDEDKLIKRYEDEENQLGYVDPNDEIEHNALQAGIDDPKLWMVKCRIGKEKECLSRVYHKFFHENKGSFKLNKNKILSAATFDSLKGYIYIEAFKECNVREAIIGISLINSNTIRIVPLNEMSKVFQFDKFENVNLKINQWVRIKNGIYEGDLAQVIAIQDPIKKIYVRLIPRMKTESNTNKDFRPLKKLFQHKKYNGVINKASSYFGNYMFYNKQMYKDGFLIKGMNASSFITEDVIPAIDELRIFQSIDKSHNDNEQNDDGSNEIDINNTQAKKILFHKGDRVKIKQNDFKGIVGKVISQTGNVVQLKLNVEGLGDEVFEFPTEGLMKDFLPGDLVNCIAGSNIGKQGCIVKMEDETWTAVIYNESSNSHFKASCYDIVLSKTFESLDHNANLTNVSIGELVQILNNRSSIFYVLNVLDYSLKVINQRNEIHTLSYRDIYQIRSFKSGLDGKNNPIMMNDSVKIIEGEYKGKHGMIKALYNNTAFIMNESFINSNGIIATNCKKIEILGSELLISNPELGKVNLKMIPLNIREMVGKTVKIIKGVWKGYSGNVQSVTEKTASVELLSKAKTIIVDIENLQDGEKVPNYGSGNSNEQNNNNVGGWNTPSYYPQTPKAGGASPKWGADLNNASKTPNYFDTEAKW